MSSEHGDGGDGEDQSGNQSSGEGGGQPQQAAPQQPQGQPPAGGQQAPPAGGQPVHRGPTASDKIQAAFGDYAVKNQIKAVLGTYALIGLGLGLTVILLVSLGGQGGAVLGIASVVMVSVAIGPVLAGLFGLSLSTRLPVDTMEGAVVSGVVNYVGFVAMTLVVALLASTQSTGFGTSVQIGQLFVPLLVGGVPGAIVAGLATALGRKVDYPATREEAAAQEPPAPVAPPQQPPQTQQP